MRYKKISHARYDAELALVPLFKPRARGRREKLSAIFKIKDGLLKVIGPEELGINDQSVFLSLVALAGPYGLELNPETSSETSTALRSALDDTRETPTLAVQTSLYEICMLCGVQHGGRQNISIKAVLERLSSVVMHVKLNTGEEWDCKLLSRHVSSDGHLSVAFHPKIAGAILRQSKHASINLIERIELRGDTARAVHARLCGWLYPSHSSKTGLNKLIIGVYGELGLPSTFRTRKSRVIEALEDIGDLPNWDIDITGGIADVFRPK